MSLTLNFEFEDKSFTTNANANWTIKDLEDAVTAEQKIDFELDYYMSYKGTEIGDNGMIVDFEEILIPTRKISDITINSINIIKYDNPKELTIATSENDSTIDIGNHGGNTTIEQIKQLVSVKEGIPCEQQRLEFNNIQLKDNQTLRSYFIQNKNTLNLILRTKGGAHIKSSFKAPNVEKHAMRKTGKNSFHFYSVGDGLNFKGICMNNKCNAYTEPVCYQGGLGKHRPNELADFDEIICPGCKTTFDCVGYYIYNCSCVIKFKKSNQQAKRIEKIVKKPNFWHLGEGNDDNDKSVYTTLLIECTRLN